MVKDRRQAHTRLSEAEAALSKADNRCDTVGGYDRIAWLVHLSHVLYEKRDLPGSIKALQDSIKVQPIQERQGRVHSYALLTQRQSPTVIWTQRAPPGTGSWTSTKRGDEHFGTMRREMRAHASAWPVKELREVAAVKA